MHAAGYIVNSTVFLLHESLCIVNFNELQRTELFIEYQHVKRHYIIHTILPLESEIFCVPEI